MSYELQGITPEGWGLVVAAERLAEQFAERADEHDRARTYPYEAIEALRDLRYFAAPVPEALGGLGISSVHDLVVASSRLARGNASVAIGINMHLTVLLNIVRRYEMAVASGSERRAAAFAQSLAPFGSQDVILASAVSERSQDLTRPGTRASRVEDGWRIDGMKVFCTMSPAASHLMTAVSYVSDDGVERYGFVHVPVDLEGVVIGDDWDALGMRASGSHSITFDGVIVPPEALRGGFRTGDPVPYMERNMTAGLFHASASLGIAEAALAEVATSLGRRGGDVDGRTAVLAAEASIDLAAARATLARAAGLVDEQRASNPTHVGADEEIVALFTEAQAAKTFVNEAAARVVDRALAMSGGAGYMSGHALNRAYRDVRAGAFMHPLGANRAYDLVGRTALGRDTSLH
jgi:alkylation response protein AidB-like acyl-CoA dehydrogenase